MQILIGIKLPIWTWLVSVLISFQLPTSFTPIMMPSSMSVSRDIPLQITVLPGGGSCARAR